MRLIYNSIELSVLSLREFAGEAVYDSSGVDYLYTRYTIYVSAQVNGQVEVREVAGPPTSYRHAGGSEERAASSVTTRPPGVPIIAGDDAVLPANAGQHPLGIIQVENGPTTPPNPLANNGGLFGIYAPSEPKILRVVAAANPANLTDEVIRYRLQTPRAQLFVFSGRGDPGSGELLLHSPGFQQPTDARNGPTPRLYGITQSMGDGTTHFVDFSIETYVNEMRKNTKTDSENNTFGGVLLSNRFSMRHELDATSHLTISVQGQAIFNMQEIYRGGGVVRSPDDFRRSLMLPVPRYFVREQVVVEALPDGTGVNYSFVDKQAEIHFPAARHSQAMQIEAVHRQAINCDEDVLNGVLSAYERGLSLIVNTKWAQENRDGEDPRRPRRRRRPAAPPPPPGP